MKKFLSISMALVMLFALIPTALSASAETATRNLTASEVGMSAMRYWAGTATITKGTDTDDFLASLTNSSGFVNDKCFTVKLPSDIYDLDLTKITITTKTSVAVNFNVTIAAYAWQQSAPTPQIALGTQYYTANSPKTYTITGDNLETMKTNKFSSIWFQTKKATTDGTFYVNSISLEYNEAATGAPTTDAVSTLGEASIRLNDENGIRFYTTVNEDKLTELVGENTYEIGTLIAPADKVTDELTHEIGKDNYLEVKYEARDEKGNIDYYTDSTGFTGIVGSIVNIREEAKVVDGVSDGDTNGNIDRDFMARAYVKVGDTYYYSATTSTRSLAQVAYAYKNSASYVQNDKVDQWAAAYVPAE